MVIESNNTIPYDALLILSFGGPEGRDDVIPFLKNVLRGRNVPRERMLEVARHYHHFDGVSPINDQNRALIAALEAELTEHGPALKIYWGNRNWHPLLTDTMRQMRDDGVRRTLAFFTSAYSSYSGCRQYRENIEVARQAVGGDAPEVDKLRMFYNHPGFIEPMAAHVLDALARVPEDRRSAAFLLFTAHSLPDAMARFCDYEIQLQEASRLVAEVVGKDQWALAYQSRSGLPTQPWLGPDVCDYLEKLGSDADDEDVVIAPIGFISDHMEVMYDLDVETKQLCDRIGLNMVRVATVGTHPRFIRMIRELIEERMTDIPVRLALGDRAPNHDVCPADCCLSGRPIRA